MYKQKADKIIIVEVYSSFLRTSVKILVVESSYFVCSILGQDNDDGYIEFQRNVRSFL